MQHFKNNSTLIGCNANKLQFIEKRRIRYGQ